MNPKYKPTDADRATVTAMSASGFAHEQIAKCIGERGIDDKTLRKHFRKELDQAMLKANATVANRAYQMAVSGEYPALTIFWLKTRLGWKETDRHELTGPGGEPLLSIEAVDRILKAP